MGTVAGGVAVRTELSRQGGGASERLTTFVDKGPLPTGFHHSRWRRCVKYRLVSLLAAPLVDAAARQLLLAPYLCLQTAGEINSTFANVGMCSTRLANYRRSKSATSLILYVAYSTGTTVPLTVQNMYPRLHTYCTLGTVFQQDTLTVACDLPRWTAQTEPLSLATPHTCSWSEITLRCRLCHSHVPRPLTAARRIVTSVHFTGNALYANPCKPMQTTFRPISTRRKR